MTDLIQKINTINLFVKKTACFNRSVTIVRDLNIDGTLTVTDGAILDDTVCSTGPVAITDTTPSVSTTTGALVVTGGLGIADDLFVDGAVDAAGGLIYGSQLIITDTTGSVSTGTGSLVVAGGAGIEKNLNVGGTLMFDGMLVSSNLTESTSPSTGSVTVAGGMGVSKNVNVGGSVTASGIVTPAGPLIITDTTSSVNKDTGSIVTEGGVGIELDLNVGGNGRSLGEILIQSTVDSISTTTGSVVIAGGMGVERSVQVGGDINIESTAPSGTPTSGALIVTGGAVFKENMYIGGFGNIGQTLTVLDITNCTSPTTGSIITNGGMGITKGLCVGDTGDFDGVITARSGTPSTSSATGAVVVPSGGGVGNSGNLNVGGAGTIAGVTSVTGGVPSTDSSTGDVVTAGGLGVGVDLSVTGDTQIDGILEVTSATSSTSSVTGALTVTGGVATQNNVFVGGLGDFTGSVAVDGGAIFSITNTTPGVATDAVDVSTGFIITTLQQGAVGVSEISQVTIPLTVTAVSLANTSFLLYSGVPTSYHVWYDLDTLGVDPGGSPNPIQVSISTGDTPAAISAATIAAINLGIDFLAAPTPGPSVSPSTGSVTVAGGAFLSNTAGDFYIGANGEFDGAVMINSTVNCTTGPLAGALVVQGGMGVSGDMCVDSTFDATGDTTICGTLSVLEPGMTPSTGVTTGAMVVGASPGSGVGITGNMYHGGDLVIQSTAASVDKDTGALLLTDGGIGIEEKLYIGSAATFGGTIVSTAATGKSSIASGTGCFLSTDPAAFVVAGGVGIGDRLNIQDQLIIEDATSAKSPSTTGALVVAGGVLAAGSLRVLDCMEVGLQSFIDGIFEADDSTDSSGVGTGGMIIGGGIVTQMDFVVGGDVFIDGMVTCLDTTDGGLPTTGAVIVAGGVGISQNLWCGGKLRTNSTTESTSISTGSITTNGGIGIEDNLAVGGLVNVTDKLYIRNAIAGDTLTLEATSAGIGAHLVTKQTTAPNLVIGAGLALNGSANINDAAGYIPLTSPAGVASTVTIGFTQQYLDTATASPAGTPSVVVQFIDSTTGANPSLYTSNVSDTGFTINVTPAIGDFALCYQVINV